MYQIGNAFTRLVPVIEFTEADLRAGSATACVLGEPPAEFASVHSAVLINAWHAKLQRCLAEPVQVEQRKGHRRVQDLGSAIFDFNMDGMVHAYKWSFNENDSPALVPMPDYSVVAEGGPFQSLWMNGFKEGALHALRQNHPGQAALCQDYVEWAQGELERQCWGLATQVTVRAQIAIAMNFDPQLLAAAKRVQLSGRAFSPVRLDTYNHAITNRQDYLSLSREAPQLIPLYALLVDELTLYDPEARQQVTARMQNLLVGNDIKPALWRLLCREGTQWMKEFLAYYDFDRQTPAVVAVDLLQIGQAFGTAQLVPTWLLHAFIQLGGTPNAPKTGYAKRLHDMFPLCKRLGHLVFQTNESDLVLFKDRAQDICNWASDHLEEMPKGYVRRASLRGLIRKTDAQQALDAMRLQGDEGWEAPYQLDLKALNVQAVILNSPLAIWTEGRDMRHCADKYIAKCRRGDWLMVSLRKQGCSRALATVAFDLSSGGVELANIAGFANTLVSAEVRQLVLECYEQLQLQCNQMNEKCHPA